MIENTSLGEDGLKRTTAWMQGDSGDKTKMQDREVISCTFLILFAGQTSRLGS